MKNGFEISSFVRFVRMIEISTVFFLYSYNNQEPIIFIIVIMIIMSNERSEDSYIDLAVFFSGKVLKVSHIYRCAFIHNDAFMNALRYICIFKVQLKFIC